MHTIAKHVTKKDHSEKTTGKALYIADLVFPDMVHAKVLRSSKAHADILDIIIPDLEEGYEIITGEDAPGGNALKIMAPDQPLFAGKSVNFIGEALLMVVGPDEKRVKEIIGQIRVVYKEKDAVVDMDRSEESFREYAHEKGDVEAGFAKAHRIFEETYRTDYQEQAYLEPQGAIALYREGKVTVYGSMQCPYYVKTAVEYATGLPSDKIQIIQATTGGAFGGKEEYPSLMCDMVAVAAMKVGKPVRLILGRREDMAVSTKRHPSKIRYRTAVDGEGNILAVDVDISLNAGAYDGLSSVVMQRAVIAAIGAYRVPALRVKGHVLRTHTVPNGAFRGFGAPQVIFAMEMNMVHVARQLGADPLEFKTRHWVRTGDPTSTQGCFALPVKLDELLEKIDAMSGYRRKFREYENQSGRYRRGIGLTPFFHGCGYTGSGERDFVRAIVRLRKDREDRVEILAANTEMGQGLKTTFCKVVSESLGIPLDQVIFHNPDTDRVPNSGPTVASRSLMIVGKLLERAARRMKEQWVTGEELLLEEHYVHPDLIPWDLESFTGDAYPAYSWGINVVEVEVDTLLAQVRTTGVWGVFDVGTVIDETIARGQAEGGMLQGLGYASVEKMETGRAGDVRQGSFTDYIIPTAKDTIPFHIAFLENYYDDGPFGAKGMGELTILGTAPAYALAVEQAAGHPVHAIPVTSERLGEVLG